MIKYQSGRTEVECPFCHKGRIGAFYRPSYLKASSSRSASAGSKVTYHREPEKYEISGGCDKCGAKKKDIQKWYDGTYEEKKLTHAERLERLRKSGLPTSFEVH